MRMPLMNGAALLIGLCIVKAGAALRSLGASSATADFALLGVALLIPLTAFFGAEMQGVSRWLMIAGIPIQPGLIVVPPLVIGFALRPSPVLGAAIALAGAGLALQPDPAAAAMLAVGVALGVPAGRRWSLTLPVLAAAVAGLVVALAREVTLPPVPFVEAVLQLALQAGPFAMVLAAATLCLLFLPAISARSAPASATFGFTGLWLAAIVSAIIGPYPAPLVGFGGSAVLGYILSVAVLREGIRAPAQIDRRRESSQEARVTNQEMRFT